MTDPFESQPTPWPNPQADLLAGDDDWHFIACMDWPRDQWIGYIGGYWKAASLIVAQVAATGRDQDYLVYPFLMCWRHHVELQLKNLIIQCQRCKREEVDFPRTHKIGPLWSRTRKLLDEVYRDDDRARLDDVERILTQLQDFDPTSEHFRYPVARDGSPTLEALPRVHLRKFHEAMEGVAHYLDATDTGLREKFDAESEAREAMRDLYGP
ncbi:hypothetical protein [Amycolatopsis sp. H20-H5]|uniref:hypothetical protein n=1 Tax=Amycolatopsis sp. H20-H5 TaxID=3046309 RepID=UPI002DC00A71|nr:hypothetical protein [Amycolatopsis sp. H20-H5]MEC3980411.1 hypothetical protein [Amycolatopsis sp. H20-H5]